MNRILLSVLALVTVATLTAPVFAQSLHFIGSPTIAKSFTTGLTVSWKAAGLANGPTAAFLIASSESAQYSCVNHGGNIAPGQPVVLTSVTGPTVNITPRNGQITFTVNIPVPTPPNPSTECPNGNWSVVLTSLTYNGVVVHVQQPPGTDVITANLGNIDP